MQEEKRWKKAKTFREFSLYLFLLRNGSYQSLNTDNKNPILDQISIFKICVAQNKLQISHYFTNLKNTFKHCGSENIIHGSIRNSQLRRLLTLFSMTGQAIPDGIVEQCRVMSPQMANPLKMTDSCTRF